MMRNRHKNLQRLLDVKTQLQQVEEWKLADLLRRRQEATQERSALFDMLADVENNDSVILGLVCRHLQRTDARERNLEQAEALQKQVVLERSLQKRALEQAVQDTTRKLDREGERRRLLELGEKIGASPSTSPR